MSRLLLCVLTIIASAETKRLHDMAKKKNGKKQKTVDKNMLLNRKRGADVV